MKMIEYKKGNILKADAEALVNTVNCVGTMGKGIALQFKKAWPENNVVYEKSCRQGDLKPGKLLVFSTDMMMNPRYIINFPTKKHWRGKSHYEFIEKGLDALINEIRSRDIHSVAIPPLGCGLGGLEWNRVRNMIEEHLSNLTEVKVLVFEPQGSPKPKDMPVGTSTPKLTVSRAMFIKLMERYNRFAYRLTLLEIQKLAYFLQEAGQNLRLNYVKHLYGPYAHNLNKVLEIMEKHYIRGYGDTQKPDVEIELLPAAVEKADSFLGQYAEEKQRLDKVAIIVDGFETPYGLELLSSVHWLAVHENISNSSDDIVNAMKNWNDRKARLFPENHIRIAWNRLVEEGWVKQSTKY
jgi:O-acetyl-ADP-ribose deacetylase (regulator of RNase III)